MGSILIVAEIQKDKIRDASLHKVPYGLVVGEKELTAETVNVRSRERGELGAMSTAAFIDSLADERKPGARPQT